MPTFRYRAVAASGNIVEGEMEAATRAAVVERLRDQGHLPIRADEVAGSAISNFLNAPIGGERGLGRAGLAVVTRELATLLGAGLPIDRSLEILVELTDRAGARAALRRLLDAIRRGASLADAMAADEQNFPRYVVSMVRAGEAGGSVDSVLARLADFIERSQTLRANIRSALIYPAIVVVMAVVALAVMLTVVLPQFEPLFEDAGAALPLLTRLVTGAADLARTYGWYAILLIVLAVALGRWRVRSHPPSRLAWDALLLRAPLVGGLIARLEAARFGRTLGTLMANGVPLLAALQIVRDTLSNAVMRQALDDIGKSLKEGQGLAEPLARLARFPRLATHLVRVGEETGQLESMLFKIAEIYDEEVRRSVARMLALLVPALTIGLGLLIALIIGGILSAILSVYSLPF